MPTAVLQDYLWTLTATSGTTESNTQSDARHNLTWFVFQPNILRQITTVRPPCCVEAWIMKTSSMSNKKHWRTWRGKRWKRQTARRTNLYALDLHDTSARYSIPGRQTVWSTHSEIPRTLLSLQCSKKYSQWIPAIRMKVLNAESNESDEMLWVKVLYTLSSVILDFTASKSTACMICTVICGAVNHKSQSALFPIMDIDLLLTLNKSRATFKSLSHWSICARSLERCRKSVILLPEHDLRISRIWPKTLYYSHQ